MLNIAVLLEVENMTIVEAIQALFAQNAPAGADPEGAFNALKGKKDSDLSRADIDMLDELAETFQDFVSDPSDWLKKASVTDLRYSWWTKLARALGASVSSTTGGSPTPAGSHEPLADPPAPDIEPEPEQGIDPDALAGGAPPLRRDGGGGRVSGRDVSVRTDDWDEEEREDTPLRKERRDRRDGQDTPQRKERRDRRDKVPRPLIPLLSRPDLVVRKIPTQGLLVLRSERYQQMRARIVECVESIRSGGVADVLALRAEVLSMSRSKDAQIEREGIHLEGLISALQSGIDLQRPNYFKAIYEIGGTYDD